MARRIGEPVEVRVAGEEVAGEEDDAPMSFLWRRRLYVVREVLGHWRERREWWATAAGRAVHGDDAVGQHADASGPRGTTGRLGDRSNIEVEQEREVWRVEASAGRTYGNGVYDLTRDRAAHSSAFGEWRLLRIAD